MPTKVLIADSDQVSAIWLKSVLEHESFAVDTANSLSAALQKIAHEVPDFLVLDVVLSDGNGLDFVRRLRQDPNARALRIIILTSKGSPADVASGISVGADDYILKRPSADVELIGKIQALMAAPRKTAPEIPFGHGKILSFLSVKGGTGTTSVLINTAYALAKREPEADILAVDMVFPMGTVGMSLGFESHKTVVKLSHEPQIDHITIERYVSARTRWGFRILIGANDPQEGADLAVNQIVPLFETLKTMYDYILVDFGRALSRISLPVIELSERIIIIVTPDISTVKGTRIFLQYLK